MHKYACEALARSVEAAPYTEDIESSLRRPSSQIHRPSDDNAPARVALDALVHATARGLDVDFDDRDRVAILVLAPHVVRHGLLRLWLQTWFHTRVIKRHRSLLPYR